jgi:hypothetical protein
VTGTFEWVRAVLESRYVLPRGLGEDEMLRQRLARERLGIA